MDPTATTSAATGREIILELVRNMREGLEPLHYSTLAPAIYRVYLHPDDFARLRAIAPRIAEEAKRALDEQVAELNRTSFLGRIGGARKGPPKVTPPEGGWQVELHENTDDEVQPGDIVIHSELALPPRPDFGAGSLTRRIATGRLRGVESATRKTDEPVAAGEEVYATIRFEDHRGPQSYQMTKNQIVIGRGGPAYWTDLRLETLPDVSREHVRLRRDPGGGTFFLKDLSRLGTTVDGQPVPSSIDYADDEKRDKNLEVPLPPKARIGLAGVVFLDFEAKG